MKVFRTIITSVTDGTVRTFTGSGESGGEIQGEILQQVSIKSHPEQNTSGLVINDGDRYYLIATDNDEGPALVSGEAVLYFDVNNFVMFKTAGGVLEKIHISTTKKVAIEAVGDVDIQANDVNVTGAINVTVTAATRIQLIAPVVNTGLAGFLALVTAPFIAWFNAHTHTESGAGETLVPTQQAVPAANTTLNTLAS